jgi:hypothetical protein
MLRHGGRPAHRARTRSSKPDDIERVRRDVENAAEESAEPRVDPALDENEAACETILDDTGKAESRDRARARRGMVKEPLALETVMLVVGVVWVPSQPIA